MINSGKYEVVFTENFAREIEKLDVATQRLILSYIDKNLINSDNPLFKAKRLAGDLKAFCKYRVGDYRIIARIKNDKLVISLITVRHRREVYSNKTKKVIRKNQDN